MCICVRLLSTATNPLKCTAINPSNSQNRTCLQVFANWHITVDYKHVGSCRQVLDKISLHSQHMLMMDQSCLLMGNWLAKTNLISSHTMCKHVHTQLVLPTIYIDNYSLVIM